jgi:hypothetical protein
VSLSIKSASISLVVIAVVSVGIAEGMQYHDTHSIDESVLTSAVLTSKSGTQVVSASESSTIHDLAVLDPSLVADQQKIASIDHTDYYLNDNLVQTLSEAPYYLNTRVASNGNYTLRSVVTFKDGSVQEQSQAVTVSNTVDPINDTSNDSNSAAAHSGMGDMKM